MKSLKTVQIGVTPVGLFEDVNGEHLFVQKAGKISTIIMEEEIVDTYRSLMAVVSSGENFYSCLTPRALIFISRLSADTYASKYLKKIYGEIEKDLIDFLVSKAGEEKGNKIFSSIVSSWKNLLSLKKKYLHIGGVYDIVFLPIISNQKGECIRIPIFDSFIIGNVIDFIRERTGAISNKDDKKKLERANKRTNAALSKIRAAARKFLSSNKLNYFIEGRYRTHFNALRPATAGSIKHNEIIIPQSAGFEIGEKVSGLRHPVMTGVKIFTVVGYSKDNSIILSEVNFQKYQSDADGDFFSVDDMIYELIKS